MKQLQPLLAARRAALNKLVSDPQANESAIRAALSQYMAAQSELYLADIHAQRAEDVGGAQPDRLYQRRLRRR